MKLARLLLPLIVRLQLFLPLVCVSKLLYLFYHLFTFLFGFFGKLDKLLDFSTHCEILICHHVLDHIKFPFNSTLNSSKLLLYIWLDSRTWRLIRDALRSSLIVEIRLCNLSRCSGSHITTNFRNDLLLCPYKYIIAISGCLHNLFLESCIALLALTLLSSLLGSFFTVALLLSYKVKSCETPVLIFLFLFLFVSCITHL